MQKPDEWVVPLKDKTIKELQDKEVVFTATFSKADQKEKWCWKGEEIFKGKQYKIEVLEDDSDQPLLLLGVHLDKELLKNVGDSFPSLRLMSNDNVVQPLIDLRYCDATSIIAPQLKYIIEHISKVLLS